MKRRFFLKCIIVAFLLLVVTAGVCEQIQGDIAKGIVRLHIVANSDDALDQSVKIKVRDAVISTQKEIFPDGMKKTLNKEEIKNLTKTAEGVLKDCGVGYGACVDSGEFYFPTKRYENITLPAGRYDAVRVVLGEGKGKNWWCVMYPPLCFGDSAVGEADKDSLSILKESMGKKEYEIISEESIKTVPAFKLVETWHKLKEKIRSFL